MESLGKLIGNFAVKNDNDIDLFKVYFYENGISFDKKFLKGVIDNKDTNYQFEKINKVWSSEDKDREKVMEAVMFMLEHYQVYLSDFFYDESELNESGEAKEKYSFADKDKHAIYFETIKETRDLNSITRKDFESKIVDKKIGEYYVENFESAKESDFFTYKSDNDEDCFIMVINDRIKIGFAEQ